MSSICIIPARGGSKRIPRKNIKSFLGKPIIAYSIEAAIRAGKFDVVMVSTDDEEIADIARLYGAEVPYYRSPENSNDYATTFDVIKEVHLWYAKNDREFTLTCCLYPCAPFVTDNDIVSIFEKLENSEFEAMFLGVRYSYPIQRSFIKNNEGKVVLAFPENLKKRTQDLQPHYHDSGQMYIYKTEAYLSKGSVFACHCSFIEKNEAEVQDIDNQSDWKIAELKYKFSFSSF